MASGLSVAMQVKRPRAATSTPKQKVFVRNSRGKVSKIVRELYLRSDIPCSSQLCSHCLSKIPVSPDGRGPKLVLSSTPQFTSQYPRPHYIVPDTNIVYHCMDVLERQDYFFDVIILQTVMDELRNRSLFLYNRLRKLVADGEKRFYVFHNEFFTDTFVDRLEGESINDRNDRAIRVACLWYQKHLAEMTSSSGPGVMFITDDSNNRQRAKAEGLQAPTLKQYISDLPNSDELLDMISTASEVQDSKKEATELYYRQHLKLSTLEEGIKSGKYIKGTFEVSPFNFLEGSIRSDSFSQPILISGRENINRSIHGDVVAVQLLPKSEWMSETDKVIEQDSVADFENADNDSVHPVETAAERQALEGAQSRKVRPTAQVVGIARRNWRSYVGHVDLASAPTAQSRSQTSVFVLPMDKRIPKIRIRTRQAQALLNKRIVVTIDEWPRTSRQPEGHFVKSLGDIESKEAETEALLLEYDVQYRPFPKAVLDCLPPEGDSWVVPADKSDPRWTGREDLRDTLICSIDPPGCQDIDDALHARELPDGTFELGVHIADVSNFVRSNTAMDNEASARGTTVYMVDKRIDMLPMLLGTNLCSLRPYVERFAFSVIWQVDRDANVISKRFTKSVISSKAAFTYEQAQSRISDTAQQDDLSKSMRILLHISKILKENRVKAGALNLASPEVKVQVDSETSDPVDVEQKALFETNSLVEEFMLLANISVAEKIYSAYPHAAMLRRHEAPPASNFEALQNILRVRKGMHLKTDTSKNLADSLDQCTDSKDPFFNTLLRIMATRCMTSAEYFCSGNFTPNEFRHYGLASPIYTHFTSPIRRYADVIVHRQLASAIQVDELHPDLETKSKLDSICHNINYRHRMAQMAGRASIEWYVGQAIKGRSVQEDAFVIKVFKNGFVVFIAKFGIEGLIRVEDVKQFDEDKYTLTTPDYTIGIFDKCTVQISDVVEKSTGKRKAQMSFVKKQ